MKVLLINGSPHKNGSTNRALEEVAATLNKNGIETEIFWIGNQPLHGCIACKTCVKTGKCVFDDSVNKCREKALTADGFIFGTPVHYAAASGAMTSFMDRLFYSEFCGNGNKAFYLKPAAAVVVARRAGTTSTYDQLNKYFGLHEMPIISSRYWNLVYGASAGQVEKDTEGMYTMRVLGANMAYFLRCKEAAEKLGVKLPEREQPIFMNFIRE